VLQQRLDQGPPPDLVMAVGPVVMMRAVAALTAKYNVKTIVSLNPIMLDGTGMCGVCRVSVGGATKFACVDGPDFDAHQVDFDGLVKRQRIYLDEEKRSMELYRHKCSGGCNHG
jgi:ferredoxin--NADP+ reductase